MLLFDHLVGGCEQRRRHCQVKYLAALRLIARSNLVGCSAECQQVWCHAKARRAAASAWRVPCD